MTLLEPTFIRDIVDYSFGDQSGENVVPNWHMKPANINNKEFIAKYRELLDSGVKYMTLFIDNIRLYRRDNVQYTELEETQPHIKEMKDKRVELLHKDSDLLELCSILADMNFIIFSAFEDTPIDEQIFSKIPSNVKAIYASNAITFGGKVIPFPYGLQRKMHDKDNRLQLISALIKDKTQPTKLLYLNHTIYKGKTARENINQLFFHKDFATVELGRLSYEQYYAKIKDHKFMICPSGNAKGSECHRDWEVLYMRRVPVCKRTPYLEKMFEGFPVLFVNEWSDVTEELLVANNHLYEMAQKMDMSALDLKVILKRILGGYVDIDFDKKKEKKVAAQANAAEVVNYKNIRRQYQLKLKQCIAVPVVHPLSNGQGLDFEPWMFMDMFNGLSMESCRFTFESEMEAEKYLSEELFPKIKAGSMPIFMFEKTYQKA